MSAPLCFGEELPEGSVFRDGDCDDTSADFHPGAAELCDTFDNDCDSTTDEDVMDIDWYADLDGDGYGAGAVTETDCARPDGRSATSDDCDDDRDWVHPGRIEICDAIDQDCDTDIDEGVLVMYYLDDDGDGYGTTAFQACPAVGGGPPTGYTAGSGDCAPLDETRYPTATEVCDAVDQDCDDDVDEGLALRFYYPDGDGDGFAAVTASGVSRCGPEDGEVTERTDCDDMNEHSYPMAMELCDGADNDCDMVVDETAATACAPPAVYTGICLAAPVAPGECACNDAELRDCDRSAFNGCEANLTTNPSHCGGCGLACPSGQACVASSCVVSPIVGLSGGWSSIGVVRASGAVQAWGRGAVSMFGSPQSSAVSYVPSVNVQQLDLGNFDSTTYKHRCLIARVGANRELRCQGKNNQGQLGRGVFGATHEIFPYQNVIPAGGPITDWIDVGVGSGFTVALQAGGTVYTWGGDNQQLGRTTSGTDHATPTPMGITDATDVAASFSKACAVVAGGQVLCWGGDTNGALGNGSGLGSGITPNPVVDGVGSPITDVVEIALSTRGGCGRTSSGAVWCWGGVNTAGVVVSQYAVEILPSGASQIDCLDICCAPVAGNAVCWGSGFGGQLGSNDTINQLSPVPVELASGAPISGVTQVVVIKGGGCALLTGGDIACWGEGSTGENGDGTSVDRSHAGLPTLVQGL